MANQNVPDDTYNLEISERVEPHLEASQDLELLAQEIAEAAVEEERRSSSTSSPTPSQQSHMSDASSGEATPELIAPDKQEFGKVEEVEEEEIEEEKGAEEKEEEEKVSEGDESEESGNVERRERGRSQSPVVDEASWEIVDAEEEPSITGNGDDDDDKATRPPAQNYCIVRKFLGSQDMWQKLKEIGMVCDICTDQNMMDASDNQGSGDNANRLEGINDLLVSCSESMVICDMPQDTEEEGDRRDELPLRNAPPEEEPKLPRWQGRIAGAMVVIELERLGGLLVASVRVNHTDLLSALASLQQLAASVGLVSYADVDVQSILARAA